MDKKAITGRNGSGIIHVTFKPATHPTIRTVQYEHGDTKKQTDISILDADGMGLRALLRLGVNATEAQLIFLADALNIWIRDEQIKYLENQWRQQ